MAGTATVTDWFALPPAPPQLSVKVLVMVSGPDVSLPEVALLPVQVPEAVQEVAFVEDHTSDENPPFETDVGFAARNTVGTGSGGGGGVELSVLPPPHAAMISGTIRLAIKRLLR